MFSNLWKHPKTTIIGLLTSIIQIGGALSLAGVGPAKYIGMATGVATALLGGFAKDPGSQSATTGFAGKASAWLLVALTIMGTAPTMGCNAQNVAQDIVNWTPALQSAVATVDSLAVLLAPADAQIFTPATAGFDAASNLLVAQAKAYLANPTATTLTQLQTQVVTLQQQVNASLLTAAKITNPTSQQHALNAINAVATIVNSILALVVSISSKTQVAAMNIAAPIKIAKIEPFVNHEIVLATIQAHYQQAGWDGNVSALTVYDVGVATLQDSGF